MLNFRIGLSGAQRTELDGELVKARQAGDMRWVHRVLSILALAEGVAVSEAARILRVSAETVRGWLKRYLLEGCERTAVEEVARAATGAEPISAPKAVPAHR